jgi:hypothetical protein
MRVSPILVPFFAGNPFDAEDAFELRVRPLNRRSLELFALRQRLEPGDATLRLQLLDSLGRPVTREPGDEALTRVVLGPRARRGYLLVVRLEGRVEPHHVLAVEAVLLRQERAVGSLGIAIRGEDLEE